MQDPVYQRLWIPGRLPSLNELLEARGRTGPIKGSPTKRFVAYGDVKKMWEERVVICARACRLQPMQSAFFTYLFREPDQRRDPSNFIAPGLKIVEDGLQLAGYLPNDGWKQVLGIATHWMVDLHAPGTTVFFSSHDTLGKLQAVLSDQQERELHGQVRRQSSETRG